MLKASSSDGLVSALVSSIFLLVSFSQSSPCGQTELLWSLGSSALSSVAFLYPPFLCSHLVKEEG